MKKKISKEEQDSQPLLMSNKSNTDDPFYAIRDDVKSLVENLKARNENFLSMVKTCDTSADKAFKDLNKGLLKDLRLADKKVKGLKDAVDVVEKNRTKFSHIANSELVARRAFVDDAQRSVDDIRSSMDAPDVRKKMDDDESKNRKFDNSANPILTGNVVVDRQNENDRFIRGQQQVTKEVIRQQDQDLDHLGRAVDRLGEISRDVNQELKEQNIMLDGLEKGLEDADQRMNVVMEALSKLLNTKDGCQIYTVVALAIILCILIALIIWA